MKISACLAPVALSVALTLASATCRAQPDAGSAARAIVTHAAEDFRQHMSPPPDQFRHVRLGQLTAPDGQTRTVLCGEFKVGTRGAWTPFATVETSHYEQWLGGGAQAFCQPPGFKAGSGRDLAGELARPPAATPAPAPVSSAPAR